MELRNPFGIVTKGFLSKIDAKRLAKLKYIRPVVLVSYSDMPHAIEPIPASRRLSSMQWARDVGLPLLISCKPVVAGWNDSEAQIQSVMQVAEVYADAIIIGGLRLDSAIATAIRSSGNEVPVLVPRKWGGKDINPVTRQRFFELRAEICPSVPLYDHTSCAVSYVLQMKNYNALRKRERGGACNSSCPASQVIRCES